MMKKMKGNQKFLKILAIGFFMTFSVIINFAQNTSISQKKQAFEMRMETYIVDYLNDNLNRIKQDTRLFEENETPSEQDIIMLAREEAKTKFIHSNMKEYLNTYFSNTSSMVTTDTLICDNGGFENDFMYYEGFTSTYSSGSNDCTPVDNYGNDIIYIPEPILPVNDRLEIVTSGVDIFGIPKVKFGNKALRINSRHGHINSCSGNYGVDRITKRFKVTEETRDFTVWYAVALENPSGHINRQPFLNIKCDLAPDNELCFDADIIKCAQHFNHPCHYDSIDILDWACHRFKIPQEEIGNIATLEIVVGDCGLGAHFGFAYIDGICEECDSSSALGSAILDDNIDYKSCDGTTAIVCGTYTPPTICSNGGNWSPDEITVPGYDISNITIDTAAKTFCFDFPLSNFDQEDCLEIYAEILFNNGVFDLPEVLTNSIYICQKEYSNYGISVSTSDCSDNNTSDILSDDYYFVSVSIADAGNEYWEITKQLVNPYPNESGWLTLATGTGNTSLEFGPYYKQDGDWWLTIDLPNCDTVIFIEAPGYCSGCDIFNDLEIRNIQCDINAQHEYIWSFDFFVPCDGNNFSYQIGGIGAYNSYSYPCGQNSHISDVHLLTINSGCQEYTFTYGNCIKKITVCPPKPCPTDGSSCDLEVYVKDVTCLEQDPYGTQPYEVELDISGTNNKHVCVFWNGISVGYIYPYLTIPLYTDVDLKIALCDDVTCTQNCDECYKWIHLNKPNCNDPRFGGKKGKSPGRKEGSTIDFGSLTVIPNPVISNEIIIMSDMKNTEFEIYNSSGQLIRQGKFVGSEYKISLNIVPGLYFVRYKNSKGEPRFVKMLKL